MRLTDMAVADQRSSLPAERHVVSLRRERSTQLASRLPH